MGRLVLTRRAGETVTVTEANGAKWQLEILSTRGLLGTAAVTLKLHGVGTSILDVLRPGQSMTFAGGSVELRPHRLPSQAILAFDFPREVHILRGELPGKEKPRT